MGLGNSKEAALTKEMLDDYNTLTFLTKPQIIKLSQHFQDVLKEHGYEMINSFELENMTIPFDIIEKKFPQLEFNPFKDRISYVFSSKKDGTFSFLDLLELFSVMSPDCPANIKAMWAFRIYKYNDELKQINQNDISMTIERLISKSGMNESDNNVSIIRQKIQNITNELMREMDIEGSGEIGMMAFSHGVGKMSEFQTSFSFTI